MLSSKGKRGAMRYKMKKAISIIAAALATAMLFSGCQATPDEPVVIGKDMEQMLEKAQDTQTSAEAQNLSDQYGIPERLTKELSGADGKLSIHVDAPITVPEADRKSVV